MDRIHSHFGPPSTHTTWVGHPWYKAQYNLYFSMNTFKIHAFKFNLSIPCAIYQNLIPVELRYIFLLSSINHPFSRTENQYFINFIFKIINTYWSPWYIKEDNQIWLQRAYIILKRNRKQQGRKCRILIVVECELVRKDGGIKNRSDHFYQV